MKWYNCIFYTGLWVYCICVFIVYMIVDFFGDYMNIPDWVFPVFGVIIPLLIPCSITCYNRQREKRGHKDFGLKDTFGPKTVEPHETKEYLAAAYPPIDRKYLSRIPKDFVLGVKGFCKYVCCPLSRDGMNSFIVGNIGAGKSSVLKALLLSCLYRERIADESGQKPGLRFNAFLIDIKGELYKALIKIKGHYRATDDSPIQVIQPSNRESWGYDVLYRVRKPNVTETEKIKAVEDIAEALIEETSGNDKSYFSGNARKILKAVLYWGINKNMEFVDIIRKLLQNNFEDLVKEIVEEAEAEQWPIVLDNLKNFVGLKNNESVQDILTTMYEKLSCFSSFPDIVYALRDNPNRTSPAALDDGFTFVDLAIEQEMLETYAPLFRLITVQVLKHCEGYQEADERNTMIIIDEAKRVGKIDSLDGMMATLRSRHVGIVLAFQTIHQFFDLYKDHLANTILSLCELKVFMSGDGDAETAKYVAGMCGKYITYKKSFQKDSLLGQTDVKYNEELRDIVDVQSMMELKERNEAIAFHGRHYFRFKKVVYYKDKILGPIYKEIDIFNKEHADKGISEIDTANTRKEE